VTLFGRRWRVQVGELDVSKLDITFTVKRTLQARPGTCELKVFNLDASHRAELTSARRPVVVLSAGYDPPPMLFRGDARKVDVVRDGADWVATITAGDGENAIRMARASTSFAPGTSLQDAIRSLGASMGVGAGNLSSASAAASQALPEGAVVRGPAAAELTRLCASAGLSWSIQDGVLQVLPVGRALSRVAVELGPDSGLVGSPERGTGSVVKAKALLIPDLVPGRLVSLRSEAIRGTYRVEAAEYTGDTRGEDWHATLTLRPPRPT
jgi:hypothetical protein